jgi:hypothetical protein
MAKAQINKQDTLGSSRADRETDIVSTGDDAAVAIPAGVHNEAITAPSHPLAVADPAARVNVRTDAIPATRVGELPGPAGTADIHGNTVGRPTRDGDLDPEGWYGGQGGITGDRTRDTVPVSEDMREAKEKGHEKLAGR